MNKYAISCSVALLVIAWCDVAVSQHYVSNQAVKEQGDVKKELEKEGISTSDGNDFARLNDRYAQRSLEDLVKWHFEAMQTVRTNIERGNSNYGLLEISGHVLLPTITRKLDTNTEWKSRDNSDVLNKLKSAEENVKYIKKKVLPFVGRNSIATKSNNLADRILWFSSFIIDKFKTKSDWKE